MPGTGSNPGPRCTATASTRSNGTRDGRHLIVDDDGGGGGSVTCSCCHLGGLVDAGREAFGANGRGEALPLTARTNASPIYC